jgi:hypothetical protein
MFNIYDGEGAFCTEVTEFFLLLSRIAWSLWFALGVWNSHGNTSRNAGKCKHFHLDF